MEAINTQATSPVRIPELKSVYNRLSTRDAKFALSLIATFEKFGKLSLGQMPYVDILIERVQNPAPAPVAIEVGAFEKVIELFKTAQKHLKFPKIVLRCQNSNIVLSLAGVKSKAPGSVNITSDGSFQDRKWFGRVSADGKWEPSRGVNADMLSALQTLLVEFGNNPADVAKRYGTLTGNCCFCGLKLSDARSTAAGFGPTCAENYGLKEEWKAATKHTAQRAA